MISQQQNKYPYFPPYDSDLFIPLKKQQIIIDQNNPIQQVIFQAKLRLNPKSQQKMIKICSSCSIPMQIRIVLRPCQHLICCQCYKNNQYSCGKCGMLICSTRRLQDKQKILSCDLQQCGLAFQNGQQQFQVHLQNHQKMKKM